jgi:hypothetical protein
MAKTNKTPLEILNEAKARLAAAEIRVAKEAAKDDARVAALSEVLESINGDINANSRQLNGPNSFTNRANTLSNRACWVRAQAALVQAQDNILRNQKEALQNEINILSATIAEGEATMTIEDVNNFVQNLPTDNLDDLITDEWHAKANWKDNTPEAIRLREQAEKAASKFIDEQDAEEATA